MMTFILRSVFGGKVVQTAFSLVLFFLLNTIVQSVCAQNQLDKAFSYLEKKGEVYFSYRRADSNALTYEALRFLSVDKIKNDTVWAYANRQEFSRFLNLSIPFWVNIHPGDNDNDIQMSDYQEKENGFFEYPTYEAYELMMYQFATDYPEICKISQFGTTANGRKLLIAEISNNKKSEVPRPKVLINGSFHGNETVGYMLSVRLIEYFLSQYLVDSMITQLIDGVHIYICPLGNPDGTYAAGNHTVLGSTRYNGNHIDLNRNFPNPLFGLHPDNNLWQPETEAYIRLLDSLSFTLSATIHGGAEVLNYPFDTWMSSVKSHADENWWELISSQYVQKARENNPFYLTDIATDGYINGGDWYVAYGTFQDYANYFKQCRDITMELSALQLLPVNQFDNYWRDNHIALINYLNQVNYGIRGVVIDSITRLPLKAKIEILNHDKDSSHVYSSSILGDFYRPISPGGYDVLFSAAGYQSKLIKNVEVSDLSSVRLNVALVSNKQGINQRSNSLFTVYPNPFLDELYISNPDVPIYKLSIYDLQNKLIGGCFFNDKSPYSLKLANLEAGVYFLKIQWGDNVCYKKIVKQ